MKGCKPRFVMYHDYVQGNTDVSTYQQDYKRFRNERVNFSKTAWVSYYPHWKEARVRIVRGYAAIESVKQMFEQTKTKYGNLYCTITVSNITHEQAREIESYLTLCLPQDITVKGVIKNN